MRFAAGHVIIVCILAAFATESRAQDRPDLDFRTLAFGDRTATSFSHLHSGFSPFAPPHASDQTFVVDVGPGLDTPCTFRPDGPLVFTIPVDRVLGDIDALRSQGLLPDYLMLEMPAYDVDFDAVVPGYAPERDRVYFNGHAVEEVFLTGANNVWKLNGFRIPIEWVRFPADPGHGQGVQPEPNVVRIDIDTENTEIAWCTAIDWASLTLEFAPRPVVMAHGIFSEGAAWGSRWVPSLDGIGLPNSNALSMGNLDDIADNAGKIGAEVASSRQRWGVDRVNIVAHSKGGLDSRHYAEHHDDIDRLIQLGTPNAGSPLADWAQTASLWLLGALPTAIIDLAGPAGVQLTTWYMSAYNRTHGSNGNVLYTSLAGDYDPRCRFCWKRVALNISGAPGDVIVPVSSVHALGYTAHRTLASAGGDESAMHTGMIPDESDRVLGAVADQIEAAGRPLPEPPARVAATHPAAPTSSFDGTVATGGVAEFTVPVDEPGPLYLTLFFSAGDLDLSLVSPGGTVFDHTTVGPNAGIDEEAFFDGRVETFVHESPEPGAWTVRVLGTTVADPSGLQPFVLGAWAEAPTLVMSVGAPPNAVPVGQPLVVTATLQRSGSPVLGATVAAKVALPDGSKQVLDLTDGGTGGDAVAGDGVYTGSFAGTALPGTYRFGIRAHRAAQGGQPAFVREGLALGMASLSSSSFGATFGEQVLDDNGNGLYDRLVIQVPVNASVSATYRILGELEDSAGNVQQATAELPLLAGANTAPLTFDGATIYQRGVDGPYVLRRLELAEVLGGERLPLQSATSAYATAAHLHSAFERAPLRVSGAGSDEGLDFDGNGLYDRLSVAVGFETDFAAVYNWSARLTDPAGVEIGFASGSGFKPVGSSSLALSFDGERIGQHGVDGPYEVRGLLVFGGGRSLVVPVAYITRPLHASQFEGFVQPDVTPPQLSVSISPDGDWPPSHELVPITTDVLVVDDYDPSPSVMLESITSNEGQNDRGDGSTSPDIVIDPATGAISLRSERSGTGEGRVYTLTWSARDAAQNVATAAATFAVPHDQGRLPSPNLFATASLVRGTNSHWNLAWAARAPLGVETASFVLAFPGGELLLGEGGGSEGRLQAPIPANVPAEASIELRAHSGGNLVETVRLPVPAAARPTDVGPAASQALDLRIVSRGRNRYDIHYAVPKAGPVRLEVFDVRGSLVQVLAAGQAQAGAHAAVWNGTGRGGDAGAGVYFVRLQHPDGRLARKVLRMN